MMWVLIFSPVSVMMAVGGDDDVMGVRAAWWCSRQKELPRQQKFRAFLLQEFGDVRERAGVYAGN
jgi:hypothetical protein